jgi:hypothetical protein
MQYFYDRGRHLVCVPYSVENLHAMALDLGIKRCWFHGGRYPHYDVPKKRFARMGDRCRLVEPREILAIIREGE